MVVRLGRRGLCEVIVALAVLGLSACGSDGDDCREAPFAAVLSAFPGELAPLVEAASIEETIEVEGRVLRVGKLGGTRVVLAMTGIGLVNAAMTTQLILDRFDVTALAVSGVAGSPFQIGDVAVPEHWISDLGETFATDPIFLAIASDIAARGEVVLEQCTTVSPELSEAPVCMPEKPAIRVGGVGESDDPFDGTQVDCIPGSNDVFGCDILAAATQDSVVGDMETAAIAREAVARGVPFIAFRAVSDGAGDPLGLPGFPTQFFAYYPLAARNAAAATIGFLGRLADSCD
jgi:nucleoside phosphorylase